MRTSILLFSVAIISIIMMSCDSKDIKVSEAFDQEKIDRMDSTDDLLFDASNHEFNKEIKVKLSDWEIFKQESEKEIKENEIKIDKIKNLANSTPKLRRKMMSLEAKNINMKAELEEYLLKAKSEFEYLKIKINDQNNELKEEIKELEQATRDSKSGLIQSKL